MSVLGSFLSSWGGMPNGIVGAVFPALAEILLREDDVDILTVQIPYCPLLSVQPVPCKLVLFPFRVDILEWTTITQFIDLPRISRNLTMVVFSQDGGNVRKSVDGKSGLEVLMLLIERGLNPALDESQRILSGPLIADLIQKVTVPYIPEPANSYSEAWKVCSCTCLRTGFE